MTRSAVGHGEPAGAGSPRTDARLRKVIVAGGVGNFIEWYDYSVYAALSPVISTLFFPLGNTVASTLASLAVFGVAFVVRPLGGLFFGQLGDRKGRRTALGLALITVSVATCAIGALPTYADIGLTAPILLVVLRLLQGFSAGGEWTGSAALMVESAADHRRGRVSAWQQFSVIAGQLSGLVIVTVISNVVAEHALRAWAWRLPFLVALVLGVVGFYIRYRMEDTPHFEGLKQQERLSEAPTKESLRTQRAPMIKAFFFVALPNVGAYTLSSYMPTFLSQQGGLSLSQAYTANVVGMCGYAILTPIFGILADRIGRRPLLIAHAAGLFVLAFPIYLLASRGSFVLAIAMQVPLLLLMTLYSCAGTAALAELFPTRLRYSGLSLPYNLSSVVFGGTAPFISAGLIALFSTPVAPAFYIMIVAIPTLIVFIRMRETAREPLRDT